MAEDTLKTREPGEDGSTQGQIQTPMCSENVANKKGGDTHSYEKATGKINDSGSTSIEGPGMKGNWDAGIKISGTNRKY